MKDSWISVKKAVPELPEVPVCQTFVIVCNDGDTVSRPMLYARRVIRAKPEECWLAPDGGNTYRIPDFWQPMPKPLKRTNKIEAGCEPDD